ncbi:MAG: efflux RND transporter periplasmic adaptor subunit [Acidobacteria bacterium]|nr:efflux RND transporter periplasmic adaptor subunit [Acidobacteriota bacterium]MBV9475448.1 efflux RND transporter periplasmic adaptor subunit [Acidobacteriota bacterium]
MTELREDATNRAWWRDRRRLVAIAVLVAFAIALLLWRGCRAVPDEEETAVVVSVRVAKAEQTTIANELTTVATLVPRNQADVTPKIAAPIRAMGQLVNRGVAAGEVLAVLESRDLAAQRAEAEAALRESAATSRTTVEGSVPLTSAEDRKSVRDAQAALDNARKTLERRRKLFDDGGISKKDLEASELAVTNAEDDLRLAETAASLHGRVTNPGDVTVARAKEQQARERLASLDAQLGYAVVRAPFAGVVTEQFQHQGDFASPGTKLLTIADPSTLIAKAEVGEAVAATLKPGDVVRVIADERPDVTIDGRVSLVGRGADAQSRGVEVWVTVPNPSGALRANGAARVVISAQATPGAVVVPSSAVTLDATNGNRGTVMVVDAQSVAHEVHVTTGIRSGGRTQIVSGLAGGETVVTEGNYGLPDGTKVTLVDSSPAAEPRGE